MHQVLLLNNKFLFEPTRCLLVVLLLNNPPVWDLDIIDDIMGDTGDILEDLDDTLVDIEKNRSVIIEINYE